MNRPVLVFFACVIVLWLATQLGTYAHKRRSDLNPDEREDFNVVLTATLTLLGLIIGFSFSMAVSRYDQRKNYEEAEANAIGTEYVRADLLPPNDAARVRALLRAYLDLRILNYRTPFESQLPPIDAKTAELQNELWSAVRVPATPNPLSAVAVIGMNDVLNSQGYTQAAWWNRIPVAAWMMMFLIAICANIMIGYGAHSRHPGLFWVLPMVAAISFFLIADIDSPRGGAIRVHPKTSKPWPNPSAPTNTQSPSCQNHGSCPINESVIESEISPTKIVTLSGAKDLLFAYTTPPLAFCRDLN